MHGQCQGRRGPGVGAEGAWFSGARRKQDGGERWTGPGVTLRAQEDMLHPCSVSLGPSSGRWSRPHFWSLDRRPLPRRGGDSCGQQARFPFLFLFFIVDYVFPRTVEEFRPVAKVTQGGEIRPHPGSQEAHSGRQFLQEAEWRVSREGWHVFLLGPSRWLQICALAPWGQPVGPNVQPGHTPHLSGLRDGAGHTLGGCIGRWMS